MIDCEPILRVEHHAVIVRIGCSENIHQAVATDANFVSGIHAPQPGLAFLRHRGRSNKQRSDQVGGGVRKEPQQRGRLVGEDRRGI